MSPLKRVLSTLLLTNFTSACIAPSFAGGGLDVMESGFHSTNFEPIEIPLNNHRFQQLKLQEEADLQKAIHKSMKSYDYEYALSLAPGNNREEKISLQQALLNDIETLRTFENQQLSLALEASLKSYTQAQKVSSFENTDSELQQAIEASKESYIKELAKEIALQYSLYEQLAQTSVGASEVQTQAPAKEEVLANTIISAEDINTAETVIEDKRPLPAIPQEEQDETVLEDERPLPAIPQEEQDETVLEDKRSLPAIPQEEKTEKEDNLLNALANRINAPFQEKAGSQQRRTEIIEALQQNEKFFNITNQEMEEISNVIASGNQQLLSWIDMELSQAEDYDPEWEEDNRAYENGGFLKAMHEKLSSLEIAAQAKTKAPKKIGRININRNSATLFDAVRTFNKDQENEQTSAVQAAMPSQVNLVDPAGPLMPPPPPPASGNQTEPTIAEKEEINDALRNYLAKRRVAMQSE